MSNDLLSGFVKDAVRTEPTDSDYQQCMFRLGSVRTLRLLHAAMGLCTEAAEFVDQLKKHIFYGKTIDTVNLMEENGDISWYQRIACDALEQSYLGMLERNVAKLKARFPDKFTEEKAQNRDLVRERVILESEAEAYPRTIQVRCTSTRPLGQQCEKHVGHEGYHTEGNDAW